MPLIGAVADDLTGATTTGVLLARSKQGLPFFSTRRPRSGKGRLRPWTPYW